MNQGFSGGPTSAESVKPFKLSLLVSGLCPWLATSREVKDILTLNESSGYKEGWKCHLLERYLEIRRRQRLELDNTEYIDQLILSICTS